MEAGKTVAFPALAAAAERAAERVAAAEMGRDAARRTEKTLDLAKMQKEKGNAECKKLSYAAATEAYLKAIRLTEMLKPPLPEEQQAATRALKLTCLVHTLRLTYRGTSLIRSNPPIGPFSRNMPSVLGGS